jgi:acetylornithine deacetylase/succinyl-diaminopimelate desuccinylase-like protein
LDLRSEDKETLALFEQVIRKLVNDHRQPDLEFTVRVVGDRPAGSIPRSHPLVALARQVLESLGATPYLETGSTDANVLLAAGLPTVTIGIAHGSNAHRVDEYIETEQVADGLWQLLQLTLATSQLLATDKT